MFISGRDPGLHPDPFRGDAVLSEHFMVISPGGFVRELPAFEQNPGSGDPLQNFRPYGHGIFRHFGQIVERAECRMTAFQHRQWPDLRRGIKGVAEKSPGQTDQGLPRILVRVALRVGHRVGEAVIHRTHPGGIRISEPCHLHGRRLLGKDQEAVVCGMPGNVYEDVNPVLPNLFCNLVMIFVKRDVPVMGERLDPLGHLVRLLHFRVAEDFHLGPVMRGEQWLQEVRAGMEPEIRRDIPDAERSVWIRVIGKGPNLFRRGLGMNLVPVEMLFIYPCRISA